MAIYTRTGDSGETSLYSGERVNKSALRVEAYGTLDELNSVLGAAVAFSQSPRILELLAGLQNQLFEAGADLATLATAARQTRRVQPSDWRELEAWIDELQAQLPRLKNFILPGGNSGASMLHLA